MTRPLFIFAADTHLSKRIWSGRPDIKGDSYRALDNLISAAIDHDVPLLLGGDLFDQRRPDSESVAVAYNAMQRMSEEELPVYFIQGQHDMSDPPWLSVHEWPIHVNKQRFSIGNFWFYGLDFQPAGVLQQELAQIPAGTDLLMSHQVWKEHMGNIGNPEGGVTEIPHAKYLLTGDYHHTQLTSCLNVQGQQLLVFSPGSTHMRAIDEPPQKYYYLFSLDNSDNLQHQPMPIDTRRMVEAAVDTEADLQAMCLHWRSQSEVEDVDVRAFLRVTYKNDIEDVVNRIRAATHNRYHLFEKSIDTYDYVSLTTTMTAEQSQNTTIESAITQLADTTELKDGAGRLWSTGAIATELANMFSEFK